MDNILERRQQNPNRTVLLSEKPPNEPRIGVPPFPEGVKVEKEVNPRFRIIRSKPKLLRDLGEMIVVLHKPQEQLLDYQIVEHIVSEKNKAFTVDLSGKIARGNLLDFFEKGYYWVGVEIDLLLGLPVKTDQELNVGIWIENTKPVVTAPLLPGRTGRNLKLKAQFLRILEDGAIEDFVLPNNQKIREALRVNVSSQ